MLKKKRIIPISITLFVVSIALIFTAFFVPLIGNTYTFTNENIEEYGATIEYVEIKKDALEIHIQENDKTLSMEMKNLTGKTDLPNNIERGDKISFWSYSSEILNNLPEGFDIPICAFSVNDTPIFTLEERDAVQERNLIILRIFVIAFSGGLIFLGVFLLVRACRKTNENGDQ